MYVNLIPLTKMLLQQEFNQLLQPFFILLLKRQICGKWTVVDTVTGLY